MSTLCELLLGICITSATGGIVCLLSPDGNMGKSVRTAMTLFILVSICLSLGRGWKNDGFAVFGETDEVYSEAGRIIEENVKEAVKQSVEEILTKDGYAFSFTEVETYITESNEIAVREIRIYGIKDSAIRETEDEIFEKTGADVRYIEAD